MKPKGWTKCFDYVLVWLAVALGFLLTYSIAKYHIDFAEYYFVGVAWGLFWGKLTSLGVHENGLQRKVIGVRVTICQIALWVVSSTLLLNSDGWSLVGFVVALAQMLRFELSSVLMDASNIKSLNIVRLSFTSAKLFFAICSLKSIYFAWILLACELLESAVVTILVARGGYFKDVVEYRYGLYFVRACQSWKSLDVVVVSSIQPGAVADYRVVRDFVGMANKLGTTVSVLMYRDLRAVGQLFFVGLLMAFATILAALSARFIFDSSMSILFFAICYWFYMIFQDLSKQIYLRQNTLRHIVYTNMLGAAVMGVVYQTQSVPALSILLIVIIGFVLRIGLRDNNI